MRLRNRLSEVLNIIIAHFLVPFCCTAAAVILLAINLNNQISFINKPLALYMVLILLLIRLLFWLNKTNGQNNIKKFIVHFSFSVFLIGLFLIALQNLPHANNFIPYGVNIIFFVIIIICGLITFATNKEGVLGANNELNRELHEEKKRKKDFSLIFPHVSKLPIIGKIYCKIYQEGKLNIFILSVILIFSAFLYFNSLGNYGFQMDEFYHASEVKTFLSGGKLFFIDNTPYGRSKVTTLLGLTSHYFFSIFPNKLSEEFILRFPIALLGLVNILLIYAITKKISSKKTALFASAFCGTEVYLTYFACYFRFYTVSIFFILIMLLLNIKNKAFSLWSGIASLILYYYVSEFFLFIAALFFFIFFINTLSRFKKINNWFKILTILILLAFVIFGISIFIERLHSGSTYNLVSLKFNKYNLLAMTKWLLINYGVFVVMAILSLCLFFVNIFKHRGEINKEILVELYVILNLIFLLGYTVNAPFNFTFRVTLFFLPLLFIVFFKYINAVLYKQKIMYVLFSLLLIINIYSSIKYHISKPGDYYFPTKLVYEKIDIVTGNKDMANFINGYVKSNNVTNFKIGYLGLGDGLFKYYLDPVVINNGTVTAFQYSKANGNATLDNLHVFIDDNKTENIFFIVNANALIRSTNELYEEIFSRNYVTEVNPKISTSIIENKDFIKIYQSQDGQSLIYIKSK
jgi:hypothetical protein